MRIPVLFGPAGGRAADAWLLEAGHAAPDGAYVVTFSLPASAFGHATGCACCTSRGPAAAALAAMFRARATNAAPFFARVIVLASPAGQAAIRAALLDDVLTSARYRLADQPGTGNIKKPQ
jgi:hypothetical protein